jgi:tetratricopeptide (TPR) repeat protein
MKKFIIFTLILLLTATGFFYLGYRPHPNDIDVTGSLFGYYIQTSQYTLYGILTILLLIVSVVLRFFMGIKNIYNGIINFITGRNKEKATDNLLNAYAHLIGQKPKTARNYLRKAERYYKDSEHTALIRLMIEQSQNTERPVSDALSRLENHKILKPIGAYVETLFSVNHKDDKRMITLFKNAGNYAESVEVLYTYLALLIRNQHYDNAENAIKNARSILLDSDYKFHLSCVYLLKSHKAYEEKNPDDMLAFGLEALKIYKNPIALYHVMQAYKTLQRDNKAIRLLNDCFSDAPSMNHLRVFLELKTDETPEDMGKRIATLPRTHETSEVFVALQAYYFVIAKDFISLNTTLNTLDTAKIVHSPDSLWVKTAKLCLVVEKDAVLLSEALRLFKDALYAECRQEIVDMYAVNHGDMYRDTSAYQKFTPEVSKAEVLAKLSLFKDMLKSVPIIHAKNSVRSNEIIKNPDLYYLEANMYKDS